jgi:uncharacterized protein (TIGR00290 family)
VKRILLAWSSGKDSAWALHVLRRQPGVTIVGLLTTFNEAAGRVSMHAVRRELVEAQAAATGLPLWPVFLPWPCSNQDYEDRMRAVCAKARLDGVQGMAFGDLFLEDVRQYRERQLSGSGLEPLFPLWQRDTAALAREMLEAGLRAKVTCLDPRKLAPCWAGREFDTEFLAALPEHVDPCGERGEFHTFAYAGPMFTRGISVSTGAVVERDGFVFADLIPECGEAGAAASHGPRASQATAS